MVSQPVRRPTFLTVYILIKSTGFDKLQESAKLVKIWLKVTQNYEKWSNQIWEDNQNIEMLTRVYVRNDFEKLLGDQLPRETLRELKDIVFNIIYSTYAKKGDQK